MAILYRDTLVVQFRKQLNGDRVERYCAVNPGVRSVGPDPSSCQTPAIVDRDCEPSVNNATI
jgi:hypothetical protein